MSLKHILNDDPSPPHTSAHPPAVSMVIDPALMGPSTSTASTPHRFRRARSRSSPPREVEQPTPRGLTYHPAPYQGAGGWDPYSGEWVQGDIFPLGPGGKYYPNHDDQPPASPQLSNGAPSETPSRDEFNESNGKKKRRLAEDDDDYQPPGTKRRPRRNPHRTGRDLRTNPPEESPVPEPEPVVDELPEPTEEERRLASSDLDDCEEVWYGELGSYVIDTHKRQRSIETFFARWIIERDSATAFELAHHYADRVARIPIPPPPPAPPVPTVEEELLYTLDPGSPSANSADGMERDTHHYLPSENGWHFEDGGAEDAAQALEESVLGSPSKNSKGKETVKRRVQDTVSDAGSESEKPLAARLGPAYKRRKVDKTLPEAVDDVARPGSALLSPAIKLSIKGKGKGKQLQREPSQDSISVTSKPPRKRGPRKKLDTLPPQTQELLGIGGGSASVSVSGDVTPAGSRPASPALTTASTVYALDEAPPPLRRAKKVDDASMLKRIKTLEDSQRKVWMNIARRDVVKVYKYHDTGYKSRQAQLKRIATLSSIQARRPFIRTVKATKDVQAKGKRLMREMLVFWKKNEKEERDVRRREQKEANDRAKLEEEKREAARQARKLEFLINQTELYSHFVGNKLKTAELEGEANGDVPAGANLNDLDPKALQDIDFDDDDETNMHRHARRNAQEAIAAAKRKAQEFDSQAVLERKTNEALMLAKGQAHLRDDSAGPSGSGTPLVDLDSDELNFQNPTSLTGELTVQQPKMLMATLKEYQLKGLNWLATLYEQGINGILADEMGLGKTVQSISLLAYLAEKHDIWGPFLVVSPASTLHNWQQEITRFVPGLKALPYWGNVKDRATLRKFWSKKEISYNQDAPFHVLITSYQLITQDQQYFQRVKWQYMILDEAQNIKNSSSARWKTLLGFQCRNRLLLTGTPIQNSMQELWALLHFIMPSLFDSHDEFNEWFSKDIENAAENKGSKLNEHQLRRLHMILKPFMLRRVKRHVQNELSEKIELDIYVDLSARQRALYKALLANVSVADLLEKAANIGDADSARSLMNLVMQFRKVCNHPELFERADVVAPFSFSQFGQSGPLNREGDFIQVPYSTRNPIEYAIPTLFYLDGGLLDVPLEDRISGVEQGPLSRLMNIWKTDWIHHSLCDSKEYSAFSFLRVLGMSPSEAHEVSCSPLMKRSLRTLEIDLQRSNEESIYSDPRFVAYSANEPYSIPVPLSFKCFATAEGLSDLGSISLTAWTLSCLSRPSLKWFVPPAVAPAINMYCSDRTFLEHQNAFLDAPTESLMLYGLPPNLRESEEACALYRAAVPAIPEIGLLTYSPPDQLLLSTMQVPEAKRLIYDSGKLARLDMLLQELKAGDHRVLVYFQMTRMMDLMEEYLIYRQYKYLRLDGSSKLEDRRDMVMEWQTRPDIFIFLLSTRAGGLGINLTAADTVVFYDHDWNPSNDAQAMDRAHRLGQTRQVTVYRLITKGTIDERIIQLARVKKDVQDIVVGNKNFTDVTKPSEIVQLLLNEDQLASLNNNTSAKKIGKRPAGSTDANDATVRDLWNEEGDEFFGHSAPAPAGPGASVENVEEDEGTPVPSASTRGKKRKGDGVSTRGRKPGGRGGKKKAGAAIDGGT